MVSNPSAQRFNASSHSLDNIAPYCVRCNSSCKLKNDINIISCCLEKYVEKYCLYMFYLGRTE